MTKAKFQTNAFLEAFNFLKECIVNTKVATDSCIAFNVSEDGVLMYTSNFMQQTSYLVNDGVEVSGEGTFLVSVANINRILLTSKKEDITFEYDGKHVLVQYGRGKYTLNLIQGEFEPPAKEEPNVTLKDNPFKFGNRMLFSCGQDCGYVMSGIHLDFNEEQAYMCACCRTSVYAREIEIEGETCAKEFNIRQGLVKLLAKFDGDIKAKLEGTTAVFSHGPITIRSSLIDGRYPKWKNAISEGGSKVVISRESMLDACKPAIACKNALGLKLTFGPDCYAVYIDKDGGSQDETRLDVIGTTDCTMSIVLDPKFIKDYLEANVGADAEMEIFHDKAVLHSEGQDYVIAAMC